MKYGKFNAFDHEMGNLYKAKENHVFISTFEQEKNVISIFYFRSNSDINECHLFCYVIIDLLCNKLLKLQKAH